MEALEQSNRPQPVDRKEVIAAIADLAAGLAHTAGSRFALLGYEEVRYGWGGAGVASQLIQSAGRTAGLDCSACWCVGPPQATSQP